MVEIIKHEGRKVVRSLDLYRETGLRVSNYYKWIQTNLSAGVEGEDYFPDTDNLIVPEPMKQRRLRYLFTTEFAAALALKVAVGNKKAQAVWNQLKKL